MDNGVLKTKLVKLIYLIDLISIEAIGKQISDYEYRFWHYGPYPIDIESTEASEDDIVKNHSFEQDITLLKVSNIATIKKGISKYGNLYSAFHLSEDREEILSKATEWFSQEERNIVNYVINRYGSEDTEIVIQETYRTLPMLVSKAKQKLNLDPRDNIIKLSKIHAQRIRENIEFPKEVLEYNEEELKSESENLGYIVKE